MLGRWTLTAKLYASGITFLLLAIEFVFRFLRLLKQRDRREEATSVA